MTGNLLVTAEFLYMYKVAKFRQREYILPVVRFSFKYGNKYGAEINIKFKAERYH